MNTFKQRIKCEIKILGTINTIEDNFITIMRARDLITKTIPQP